jgi:hypothetical protein
VIVWPSALVWLPSWQRKQPGESLCPRLFGCGVQRFIRHVLQTQSYCGAPILESHPLGVTQQRQQESHRRDENPGLQFPFSNLGEPMQEPRLMPAAAIGWRKTKYAVRNAAAVQYCSLLGKLKTAAKSAPIRGKGLILLLQKFISAPESDPKADFMDYAARSPARISSRDCG